MKQKEYPVYKGQELEVTIEGYTSEGQGVARVEGLAVFVTGGLAGERLKIRIAHLGHTAAYGDILEILAPSPQRRKPECPYAGSCGGCTFWHMSYEEELRAKAQRVSDALTRIGGLNLGEIPITGSPSVIGYRNKAQYPVGLVKGKPEAGFFRQQTHQVVPVRHCRIQSETADRARETVVAWMQENRISVYDEKTHRGLVRHIYVRTAMATGQVLVCLVINGEKIPQEKQLVEKLLRTVDNLCTVCLSIHKKPGNAVLGDRFVTLYGPGYIEDVLCGKKFRLSPRSFYQVNRDQAEHLYEKAVELAQLTGKETALDLYCGTGTISLVLSACAKKVIGVEIIPAAIRDAKENAVRNGVDNVEFLCADAAQAAARFAETGVRPDVIVVDPPRKGIDAQVVDAMIQMAPARIVYVSCDPATLARDLKRLEERGYQTQSACAFDMFPRCAHVETVVLLLREKVDGHINITLNTEELGEIPHTPIPSAEPKENSFPKPTRPKTFGRATYPEIKEFIMDKYGFKVHSANIAEVKDKCGIKERENYNLSKKNSRKSPCTAEKEAAIIDAFKHFHMITAEA